MNTLVNQNRLAMTLSAWAGSSMVIALIGFVVDRSLASHGAQLIVRGIAAECMAWGLVEVGGTLIVLRQTQVAQRRRQQLDTNAHDKIVRLLRFVARLSIAFLLIGLIGMMWGLFTHAPLLIGHGLGVLIQCLFLLLLDRRLLRRLTGAT
jgi:hypothetical protein